MLCKIIQHGLSLAGPKKQNSVMKCSCELLQKLENFFHECFRIVVFFEKIICLVERASEQEQEGHRKGEGGEKARFSMCSPNDCKSMLAPTKARNPEIHPGLPHM